MTTTSTSLVWLVNDDPAAAVGSRDLIRANAAAWGHRVRRQKPRARARDAALLAPDAQSDIIEQPYRTLKLDIPGSGKRKPCLPPARVPRPPSMLEDESFGLQMDHVLVRFHAIAGQIGLDWLQSVADVRDDQLVHATFKALICGLDSTTTAPARQRRCAEILPAIRKRISSPDAVHMKNMVHLIFLLSYQELLVWNNAKAWMMHISGLSAVVQTLGPQAFTTPSDLRTFQQIRLFTIPLNFFLRRSSFLETPKWHTMPWSHGVPKDLLDYVLDTLTFIPGLLGLSDQVRVEPGMTKQLDKGVAGVAHALNSWRCDRLTQYMSTLGFEDLDFEDLVERLSDGTLVDTVVAQSVVLHFSTWLFLPRIDPIYVAMLPWSTQYIIRSILNICEEYSYHQQGMGILPWTTAIRVALFTSVGNDGTMQSWGRELCVRLERRYSVRLLSDIIASLPGAGPDEKLKFDD